MACEGPVGPQGAPGLDGVDGEDGVANIIAGTFSFSGPDLSTDEDSTFASVGASVEEITDVVVAQGSVMAYLLVSADPPAWVAMPFTFEFGEDDPDFPESRLQVTYGYAEGEFFIQFYSSTPGFSFGLLGNFAVKIVILPPPDEDDPAQKLDGVDVSDYEAVRKALGLKDDGVFGGRTFSVKPVRPGETRPGGF